MGKTLYEKLWDSHIVAQEADGDTLIYVDRHLLHEVSTPQSFAKLFAANRKLRRPETSLAVADHAVPTASRNGAIADYAARQQVATLEENCRKTGIKYLPLESEDQGIVHVVGPERGFALPGTTLVCGDSHTSTHGAFGALAFGIGASECEVVMATQCLYQRRAKTMAIEIAGTLQPYVSAKDLSLHILRKIGAEGASGYAVEYLGEAVITLDISGRMTLCNMTIEAGSRIGMIAPDAVTFDWLEGRIGSPKGDLWADAVDYWNTLPSDEGAVYDRIIRIDASEVVPQVSWGTSPHDAAPISGAVPDPQHADSEAERDRQQRAIDYMGLRTGTAFEDIAIDQVFIGSCTNGRIEDLRSAANVIGTNRLASHVKGIVVPGSTATKMMAEAEGLDQIFLNAGFEWRHAGCSMCVAMNADRLHPGQRCASTSNRNFEGRQGRGSRTHLMNPAMAAAAGIAGHLIDVRRLAR
jgi:3-isopropylmalate/(R)-2-methylmalate dehydratase large subunit